MKKELILWQFIAKQLQADGAVMLLLVAESSGSSPGRQGFKMAIAEDGTMTGSIGGGIMEVKLVELAKKSLKENASVPVIKKQIHTKAASQHQSGMICSGEQTVIYVGLDQSILPEVQKIIRVYEEYQSGYLQISYTDSVYTFKVTDAGLNELKYGFVTRGEIEYNYRETIGYKNRLYIVGGGHCALALSELMNKFDFFIHLIDDREELNTIEQNHYVHRKHIVRNFTQIGELIPSGDDVYVIIMTLGYRTDKIVLKALHDKEFFYLGLLGSESKIKTLKEELIQEGVTKDYFDQMHAPAGLRINSHSPEEIAVSIAAEIIGVKNSL